ncbi:MAG TPA: SBBP repeat-containing protein [Candidatus Paceibacterota bacterium]|nr:SBBP repeat-containing protein [Candidatus Paceibacterota bacterium]
MKKYLVLSVFVLFLVFGVMFPQLAKADNVLLNWVGQIGGAGRDISYSNAIDSSGNVYTTGFFSGTADLDPGIGNVSLTSALYDAFVLKMDSDGNFVWAKQMGGTAGNQAFGRSLKVDASKNVYITGYFSGTVDFDPGAGTFPLTAVGGTDVFIVKLNSSGNFVWAKQVGGHNTGTDSADSKNLTLDSLNNIYISGSFSGTVDFDPGASVVDIVSPNNSASYVLKLDSDGNFVWAKQMGTYRWGTSPSAAVDSNGNVYFSGYFDGTDDFDPGAGIFPLTAVGTDSFVVKLDSSSNFVWAKQIVGSGVGASTPFDSVLDFTGNNLYLTGYFTGTVDFDPGVAENKLIATSGTEDIFILKLDSDGNFVWVKQIGGTGAEDESFGIAIDSSGNTYTAGFFNSTVDFDPGAGTYNLASAGNSKFVLKLDSDGNFVWAKQMGSGSSYDASVAVDSSGDNVWVAGSFSGTGGFDPGVGTTTLTSFGDWDSFISKLVLEDVIPPTVSLFNPLDNAIDVAVDTNLAITFNEDILIGNGKTFRIYKTSDDSLVETVTGGDPSVTIVGNVVTVNPSNVLDENTGYYVLTEEGAVTDLSGNPIGAISNKTFWNFTTILTPRSHTSSGSSLGAQVANLVSMGKTTEAAQLQSQFSNTSATSFTFTKLLKYSMINNDVKELQKFLNTHGYQVATTGAGSPGHETNYFGTLTKKAVIKFQLANKLVGDGIIGPKTNTVINSLK